MLYAHTVFFTIYKLRKDGERLPIEEAKNHGIQGELRLTRRRPLGMPCIEATLLSVDGCEIEVLKLAEVRRIDTKGLLLHGYDGGMTACIPQVWWCVLQPISTQT